MKSKELLTDIYHKLSASAVPYSMIFQLILVLQKALYLLVEEHRSSFAHCYQYEGLGNHQMQ